MPPNPTPPDTSPADQEWLSERRVHMPIKCFETGLKLQGGALTLPRSYIYATRITPADTFGRFAKQTKNDPAWRYHEIDASHSPNVTAPEALMALLQKIAAEPEAMKQLRIGDITIDAVIEREGPWRRPQDFFPAYDDAVFKHHLATMEPEVFDAALGLMVITYQTFVVRTPRHTILVDTCTGEDKGHPPPFDFPGKERWRNELFALGVSYESVDYVFCTHLHIDHTGWNTILRDGRWVPTFPNAKYVFHKKEYAVWEAEHARGANPPGTVFRDNCLPIVEAGQALLVDDDYALDDTITLTPTPGHSPCHCCVNIFSRGQRAVVAGDLMHHMIQCREPDWSARPDWDAKQSAVSRRKFFAEVADTDTLILPVHFPTPTVGLIKADGDGFDYRFKRD